MQDAPDVFAEPQGYRAPDPPKACQIRTEAGARRACRDDLYATVGSRGGFGGGGAPVKEQAEPAATREPPMIGVAWMTARPPLPTIGR